MKTVFLKNLTHILFCLVLGTYAQAQTVLVSDIDDTVKASHVLDLTDAAKNLFYLNNHFIGMSEIYNLLQASSRSEPIQFFYVSNAPDYIEVLHEQFLIQNRFPSGVILLRDGFTEENHKILEIIAIIEKTKPAHLILIGDNGEQDVEIYKDVARRYPSLKISTFIHQVYSIAAWWETGKPLLAGQTGFVTAVDLAGQFKNLGLIDKTSYDDFVNTLIPEILKEKKPENGEMAFPRWMDCGDFNRQLLDVSSPLLVEYAQKVLKRCDL